MSPSRGAPALPDLDELARLVRAAAREELLPRFADVQRHTKHDGSVVTAADHAMQDRLQAELARRWPQYAFLGEEMPGADHERLVQGGAPGLWCLDPLDGTTNYAAGLPFFGVSLALVMPEGPALGLVYDPVRDECFAARREAGASLNGAPLRATGRAPELRRCVAVVDFKRLPRELARELGAHPPYGSQRNFGACSLEWCWLAAERFHIYLHGGQKLWDYAAGSLILKEAGAPASTLAGEEVFALALAPRSVVAAMDPETFARWRSWLAARLVEGG